MLKRIFAVLAASVLTAMLVLWELPANNADALVFTPSSTVYSEAAVLLNTDTGAICYEKNADKKEMPAALAQIMTAVIVLENCSDISTKTITATAEMFDELYDYEYQSDLRYAGIDAGNTLTVEDLLYAMLLTSSCEAAVMLVNEFGGSEAEFAAMMNAKAEELGMNDTRFTNGTGLYSARQVATARDMMTLLQYAMTVPHFEAISCAISYRPSTAAAAGKEEAWSWKHSNIMIDEKEDDYYCNGVRGIKTGNLQEGGRCIACKASRDGNNYLLVCMNAPMYDEEGAPQFYHLSDAKGILEWAFTHLSFQEILPENKELDEIEVVNAKGADYVILTPAEGYSCMWCDTADISSVQQIKGWVTQVEAPVQAGDKLGTVTLKLSGETLAEIDVVAASSVERSFWKYNMNELPGFFHSTYLRNMWIWGIVLTLLYLGLCIFFAMRYRAKHRSAREAHRRR